MSNLSKNMNRAKFFLNTYEQQIQIENRLNELLDCLKISDQIRINTEQSKQKVKNELDTTFDQLKVDLSKLSNNMYKKFESELIKDQIDMPIRNSENDINQLIGNLNSLSLLNDSEKLLCLKQIDSSIQQIKQNLKSIDNYRKSHVDNFYSSQHHLSHLLKNQIDNIQNTLNLNQTEDLENSKWLLTSKPLDTTKSNLKKANSYELINYDKEWAEVLEEFDDCDSDVIKKEPKQVKSIDNFSVPERFGKDKKDMITKLLNDIYAKPIGYWLLNQS
ncbi:hypothetical protein BpHYR1_022472 [Brachionus plicatilis]|uniref:Uncharacterized protein n=1 Tax=Brachionus plicatilis TaxID=10195 RepID=A0A3M7Q056_BRAPC|nr:hypothetical protein BpHYR1_022472 [Brachionus plicatilis]